MNSTFINELMGQLRKRGCAINEPASDQDFAILEANYGEIKNQYLIEMYKHFNGFQNYDYKSWMLAWKLADINKFKPEYRLPQRYLPCCDFMINADIFSVAIDDETKPVLNANGEEVATCFRNFWERLIEGSFDIR